MTNFREFSKAINKQVNQMMKEQDLFVIMDTCDLYESYLAAFPEGSDPIFRVKTVHDCSCCKNFIRNFGGVVSLKDNKRVTIWDVEGLPEPYNSVATRMREMVQQYPIAGIFRTSERMYGREVTYGDREFGANKTWDHLWSEVRTPFQCTDPDAQRGARRTNYDTLKRSVEVITMPVLREVLSLAQSETIYRGAEHVRSINNFMAVVDGYQKAKNTGTEEQFLWLHSRNSQAAVFKNTVIGTLVWDLADGVDLEEAVRRFESKVAPQNYKRSKSLITEKMVDEALATLTKLNLENAIHRRVAVFEDISVNDVLFVNNTGRMKMKDGLKSKILQGSTKPVAIKESTNPISIDSFIKDIVPKADSIRLLLKARHTGNFMTLTAPVDPNVGPLFKWTNNFGWSYRNDVTDSIRERVKRAGGNVDKAAMRVSLSWFNGDDLDLHSDTPFGHVYYGNKNGILDVDMNAGGVQNSKDPVENQSFKTLRDGAYSFHVKQFSNRNGINNAGFEIEFTIGDAVWHFSYSRPMPTDTVIQLFNFDLIKGVLKNFNANPALSTKLKSQEIWGVQTEQAVEVTTLLNSPNHWEGSGGVGQKHWFFILDECRTNEPTRGLYNEFLRSDLNEHRKVFEILGSKTMCDPLPNQMSGVGFTTGRNQSVSVMVSSGDTLSNYNILF